MAKYRKKPVVIDAVQWDGSENAFSLIESWCGVRNDLQDDDVLIIPTLEGDHRADLNDWIIKGECYPCKPDIFALTYDAV